MVQPFADYDGLEDIIELNRILDERYDALMKKGKEQNKKFASTKEKESASTQEKTTEVAKQNFESPS